MGIPAKWNLTIGHLPHGPLNKISDVPGVTVGHCTLADGDVQTGVTALLPHPGDLFHEKLLAASHVINGFGKTTGLVQIDELGTLETPILLPTPSAWARRRRRWSSICWPKIRISVRRRAA